MAGTITKSFFLLFLLLQCHLYAKGAYNEEPSSSYVFLNNDGTITEETKVPSCKVEKLINLIAYKFHLNRCSANRQCHKEKYIDLSSAEELELYRMCSRKSTCKKMKFPPRSSKGVTTSLSKVWSHGVSIKFQCIGKRNFVNMCSNGWTNFSGSVHLMYDVNDRHSNSCTCFISNGEVSILINDVRLGLRDKDVCSSSVLRINQKVFACNSSSSNLGAIIRTKMDNLEDIYIWLTLNSPRDVPEMVWLIITATASARLSCKGRATESMTIPPTTRSDIVRTTYTDQEKENPLSEGKNSSLLYGVMACFGVLVMILAVTLLGWYICTKIKRSGNDQNVRQKETTNQNRRTDTNGTYPRLMEGRHAGHLAKESSSEDKTQIYHKYAHYTQIRQTIDVDDDCDDPLQDKNQGDSLYDHLQSK